MNIVKINVLHTYPNLNAIRQWNLFYSPQYTFVPQAVAQMSWGHNRLIILKIKNVNYVIAKRFSKKQSMQWTKKEHTCYFKPERKY